MIPYGRQDVTQGDIDAVVSVLRSDFLTQGPVVPKFEKCVTNYCGATYGVATNSATSALHIACLALGLKEGDIAWTSPITFVASANAIIYCGASVDFVDIDPLTYNISIPALAEKLHLASIEGKLPKLVIAVDFAGQACDLHAVRLLADKYGFKVIEDASHAIGGKYLDLPIGASQYSDITVFSFHPVKIVTCAEGGMAVTNNQNYFEKMSLLRSHGITRNKSLWRSKVEEDYYYEQIDLGFNYRMSDIHAALGLSQMNRVNEYVLRRHQIADLYLKSLSDEKIILPFQHKDAYSAFHLFPIQLKGIKDPIERDCVIRNLRAAGIGCNLHYIPVHLQPFYAEKGFRLGDFPEAEHYYKRALTLPLFPGITNNQVDWISQTLLKLI